MVRGLENELEGITVISVEQAVAGPYCGMLLADAGARVIKVERPGGDFARIYDRWAEGESAIFIWLNRGKESICLDIKSDEDMALLRRMAEEADVLLSNLAPGAMERYGLTGDLLRKANPGLITCMLSGYGRDGKAGRKKAYDFLVQAESGVVAVTGTPEEPVRVGISMTDLSTGLTAFSAILRALHQRHRTGKGLDLEVNMFDVMTDWMNMALLGYRYSDVAPQRYGLTHGFVAPYGAYQSKDGRQVMLSIQNDREWSDFCLRVLRQPDLVEDPLYKHNPERYQNRVALAEIINAAFAAYDKDDIIEMLEDTRIACASLNSVAEVSKHEFLQNRTVQMGNKIIDIADLPVRRAAGSVTRAPVLDEHGAKIRKEFS
ncbi:MAG: CoA transferase [Alphaproteobacteria bacterium]|nr:CoA transferase [Alphaproteobacteria bacterium]